MCAPGQPPELIEPAASAGCGGTARQATSSTAALAKPARAA